MSIREIRYNVTSLGVTPASHQWGGVQHEDNATTVSYFIGAEYLAEIGDVENLRFRIDFNSPAAGYEPSANLTLTEADTITRDIPRRITQFGGQVQAVLVISRLTDGETVDEILQIPSTIFFTSANRQDERFNKNLSAYEEYIGEKISQAVETLGIAEELACRAKESAQQAEELACRAKESAQQAQKSAEFAKSQAVNALNSETIAEKYSAQAVKSADTAKAQVELIEKKLANGDFKGDDYILTEADKNEIADIVKTEMFIDVSEVAQ